MKRLLVVIAVFCAAVILTGCSGPSEKEILPLISNSGILEKTAELLAYASLAPSSLNTQPWKIKIISDHEFIIRRANPGGRQLFLSIGAFWENLEQAAPLIGFKIDSRVFAKNFNDMDIIKIRLKDSTPKTGNSLSLIRKRFTNRSPYDKKRLAFDQIEELSRMLPGHLFYFSNDTRESTWIAKSLTDAGEKNADNCAGYVVITSSDSGVLSVLNTGRMFERFALKCTEFNISCQPVSQLLEVSPWKENINESINVSDPIQFVVRVGYFGDKSNNSTRRHVRDFISK